MGLPNPDMLSYFRNRFCAEKSPKICCFSCCGSFTCFRERHNDDELIIEQVLVTSIFLPGKQTSSHLLEKINVRCFEERVQFSEIAGLLVNDAMSLRIA